MKKGKSYADHVRTRHMSPSYKAVQEQYLQQRLQNQAKRSKQMKIKTSELTGAALDWAVATCEGFTDYNHATETMMPPRKEYGRVNFDEYSYSTDWARGGPIIQREELSNLKCYGTNDWGCNNGDIFCDGPTPLIAAMRCYITCKLGDEVEIPEELI